MDLGRWLMQTLGTLVGLLERLTYMLGRYFHFPAWNTFNTYFTIAYRRHYFSISYSAKAPYNRSYYHHHLLKYSKGVNLTWGWLNSVSDRGEACNRDGACNWCLDPANKRSWPLGWPSCRRVSMEIVNAHRGIRGRLSSFCFILSSHSCTQYMVTGA